MSDKKQLNRRDFLKGAAISGAGIAAAGALGACSPTPVPATPVPATSVPTKAPAPTVVPATTAFWLPAKWDYEADVVVVGYGGAGASAAIAAFDAGAKVILLEKMVKEKAGGNTWASGGGIITSLPENKKLFRQYLDALDIYHQAPSKLLDVAADEICNNPSWIQTALGTPTAVSGKGATPPFKRPYYGRDAKGVCEWDMLPGGLESVFKIKTAEHIWKTLAKNVESRKIEVLYETPALRLVQDSATKEILGVIAKRAGKEVAIRSKRGVILTCGGYEFNEDMHLNYATGPSLYYGTPGNTGDGIKMAQAVGADLWHMNDGMMFGDITAIKVPEYSVPVEFTGHGERLSVDKYGKRFMDETTAGCHGQANHVIKYFSKELVTYPMIPCYVLVDEACRETTLLFSDAMDWVVKIEGYKVSAGNVEEIRKGWLLKADTVKELAGKIGALKANEGKMSPVQLEETVAKYNSYCQQGKDPDFGRDPKSLVPLVKPPFYAAEVYPGSRNVQGGPRRNENANIVDVWGNPIPRLYSAGEMGSIWVRCYQGAGNLAECLAFGRISGRNAAAEKPVA